MNTLIKLRVGLKGQLNHVSRLIKATSLKEHRDMGRDYWTDTHMWLAIWMPELNILKIMKGRKSGISLIKLSNVSRLWLIFYHGRFNGIRGDSNILDCDIRKWIICDKSFYWFWGFKNELWPTKTVTSTLTVLQVWYLSALMIMSTIITSSALTATPRAVLPCYSNPTHTTKYANLN